MEERGLEEQQAAEPEPGAAGNDDDRVAPGEGVTVEAAGRDTDGAPAIDAADGSGRAPPSRLVLAIVVGAVVLFLAWTIRQTWFAAFPS